MTLALTRLLAVAMSLAAVALVLAMVVAQLRRRWGGRRRSRRGAPGRRLLLELAAGEYPAAEELVRLSERSWRAAEPTAVALVAKIRGEPRDALIEVFQHRGVATRAIRQLRRRGSVRRARAAEILGTLRHRDAVAPLCALLTHVDPEVRVVACRSLGRIGDVAAVGALLTSLDRAGPPQQAVAHALLELGGAAEPALLGSLPTAGPQARATIVEVLGLRRALGAIPAMTDVLWQDPVLEVRVRALRALGRTGGRAALGPLLDAVAPDQPSVLRTVAARALGELGDPAATARLVALLPDPNYRVAHNAAAALLRLGEPGADALRAVAGSPDSPGAAHAREALAQAELDAVRLCAAGVGTPQDRGDW